MEHTNTPPSNEHSGIRLIMEIRHGPTIVDGHFSVDEEIVLNKKDGGLAPGQFNVLKCNRMFGLGCH